MVGGLEPLFKRVHGSAICYCIARPEGSQSSRSSSSAEYWGSLVTKGKSISRTSTGTKQYRDSTMKTTWKDERGRFVVFKDSPDLAAGVTFWPMA
jgi:hypothetical protein